MHGAGGAASWLLRHTGQRFLLLLFVESAEALDAASRASLRKLGDAAIPVHALLVARRGGGTAPAGCAVVVDSEGLAARRLDGRTGTTYLLRPDQQVAARWRKLDAGAVQAALARATAQALAA